MLTLDTSGILALGNRKDPSHKRVKEVFTADRGPFLVPATILCETTYFLGKEGIEHLDGFVGEIERGGFALDCGEDDLPRVRELIRRYADLPLGFADAAVIACAERNGGRVLTLDVRDFGVVAKEGTIEVLPAPRLRRRR